MKRKYILILVALILIGLTGYKLATNKKALDEKSKPEEVTSIRIPVKVATAQQQLLELSIVKTGNLAPFKEAKVMVPTSGILQQVRFELGDQVKAGQVLGIVDSRQTQLELQKSETKVAKLKNDLQTYTELYEGKAATKEKVLEIQQNYDEALNQSIQLRKQIADASVKAPISGIIAAKALEQGVFANAGAELGSIVNLSQAKVQVSLTEMEVYQIQEGQQVNITAEVYPDKIFPGKITFISPQADATHNYSVEILIQNTGKSMLRSGTFVYADFSRKTQQTVLLIPREALTESIKNASVYVVDSHQQVVLTSVKTGRELKGMIEITEGLKTGDLVVTSGQINLKNGTQVHISN